MVPKNKSLSTAASVIRALTVAGNANILEIWYKNHQQDISSANIMALLLVILLWYCNGMESCCRQNGDQSPGTRTGPSILSCMIHLYSDWHHISCCAVTYSQSTSSVVAAKTRSHIKWPTSTKWMTPQTDNPVSTCHDASGRHWTDFVQVMASVMLAKRYSNWPALTCAHAVTVKQCLKLSTPAYWQSLTADFISHTRRTKTRSHDARRLWQKKKPLLYLVSTIPLKTVNLLNCS